MVEERRFGAPTLLYRGKRLTIRLTVEYRIAMLKKIGGKYVVFDISGKRRLVSHDSRSGALKQLAAIEISKKKQKG